MAKPSYGPGLDKLFFLMLPVACMAMPPNQQLRPGLEGSITPFLPMAT